MISSLSFSVIKSLSFSCSLSPYFLFLSFCLILSFSVTLGGGERKERGRRRQREKWGERNKIQNQHMKSKLSHTFYLLPVSWLRQPLCTCHLPLTCKLGPQLPSQWLIHTHKLDEQKESKLKVHLSGSKKQLLHRRPRVVFSGQSVSLVSLSAHR